MPNPDLLSLAYYGTELDRLDAGTATTRSLFQRSGIGPKLEDSTYQEVRDIVLSFFQRPLEVFGGPITAGDGWFIAAFVASVRPSTIIEVGVASGYSSAFLLTLGDRFRLFSPGRPFLHSYDIAKTNAQGREVGDLVSRYFGGYLQHWKLNTGKTTAGLPSGEFRDIAAGSTGPVLIFIDGGHTNPWPSIDLAYAASELPKGSIALMQDGRMMERWIADSVIFGVQCPRPVRGVQIALTNWSGKRIDGLDICYNMSAVELGPDAATLRQFINDVCAYPFEESTSPEVDHFLSRYSS